MYEDIRLHLYILRCQWLEFSALQGIFSRKRELARLIEWATRKHLIGPRRLYERRLEQEEERLAHAAVRSPGLLRFAWMINSTGWLLCPEPRPQRGAAAKYRYCNLTEG